MWKIIPEFNISILGGWIYSLIYLLIIFIQPMFYPKEAMKKLTTHPAKTTADKIMLKIQMIIFFGIIFYAIFTTVKINTIWCLTGNSIFLISMVCYIFSTHNYLSTPIDQPVVKGFYKISRNPIHFFSNIAWFGIGIATTSWIIIVSYIIASILLHFTTLAEEKFCIEK